HGQSAHAPTRLTFPVLSNAPGIPLQIRVRILVLGCSEIEARHFGHFGRICRLCHLPRSFPYIRCESPSPAIGRGDKVLPLAIRLLESCDRPVSSWTDFLRSPHQLIRSERAKPHSGRRFFFSGTPSRDSAADSESGLGTEKLVQPQGCEIRCGA